MRIASALKRRSYEADTGMARSQRLLDHGKYLLAPRVQLKNIFRGRLSAESWALIAFEPCFTRDFACSLLKKSQFSPDFRTDFGDFLPKGAKKKSQKT